MTWFRLATRSQRNRQVHQVKLCGETHGLHHEHNVPIAKSALGMTNTLDMIQCIQTSIRLCGTVLDESYEKSNCYCHIVTVLAPSALGIPWCTLMSVMTSISTP